MKDKELRKLIGSRAKQRRLELGVNQPYIAEKMGVTASTIQRYEAGTIDNTKKLVLDGLRCFALLPINLRNSLSFILIRLLFRYG